MIRTKIIMAFMTFKSLLATFKYRNSESFIISVVCMFLINLTT